MAFGSPPKFVEQLPLDSLTPEEFLALAVDAARELSWKIGALDAAGFLAYTKISLSSWGEEIKVSIEGDTATLRSHCSGNQLLDWGRNQKNIMRFLDAFERLKQAAAPGELAQKYSALYAERIAGSGDPANSEDPDRLTDIRSPGNLDGSGSPLLPAPTAARAKFGFLSIFNPVEGFFITPILIDLNILVFVVMVCTGVNFMLPDNGSLIRWGANFSPLTLDGEWWRLLTCCFLHIGVLHLLMNMYALLYIGLLLEPYLGRLRFLTAYLLTGLLASLSSLGWHDLTVSAGASGAIFGMYGVFLAMLTTNLIERSARQAFLTSILIFVGYNLLNGMKGGIDNAAHIGGLVSGLLIGYAFYPGLKRPEKGKPVYSAVALVAIVGLASSFVIYRSIPNYVARYDQQMKIFAAAESAALAINDLSGITTREDSLRAIKEKGIGNWNKNIGILTDLNKTKLPPVLHEKLDSLLRYCDLRLKSCELYYKAVDENTDQYDDQRKDYNKQIRAIVEALNAESDPGGKADEK